MPDQPSHLSEEATQFEDDCGSANDKEASQKTSILQQMDNLSSEPMSLHYYKVQKESFKTKGNPGRKIDKIWPSWDQRREPQSELKHIK
ncbi:uncharacterized protein LOC144324186 isoform X2 [Canis aureus]